MGKESTKKTENFQKKVVFPDFFLEISRNSNSSFGQPESSFQKIRFFKFTFDKEILERVWIKKNRRSACPSKTYSLKGGSLNPFHISLLNLSSSTDMSIQ